MPLLTTATGNVTHQPGSRGSRESIRFACFFASPSCSPELQYHEAFSELSQLHLDCRQSGLGFDTPTLPNLVRTLPASLRASSQNHLGQCLLAHTRGQLAGRITDTIGWLSTVAFVQVAKGFVKSAPLSPSCITDAVGSKIQTPLLGLRIHLV